MIVLPMNDNVFVATSGKYFLHRLTRVKISQVILRESPEHALLEAMLLVQATTTCFLVRTKKEKKETPEAKSK